MDRFLFPALILVALLIFSGSLWALDKRIKLQKGATEAQVTGQLTNKNERVCYVAHAQEGQHLRVEAKGVGAIRGFVTAPSSVPEYRPGDVLFDDDLKKSGKYRICVEEDMMREWWSGPFQLVLTLR